MIATRPDWCISRQRIWGVPIAVFMCEKCNKPIMDPALNRKIVDLFEREGIEAWDTTPTAELLAAETACAHCGGTEFRKETDILGRVVRLRHELVCRGRVRSRVESRLHLVPEGRRDGGFFISRAAISIAAGSTRRLLTSVALRGHAPYSHVSTAGWTLDEQGRAMSKSLGNGVDPVDIANRLGRRDCAPVGGIDRLSRGYGGQRKPDEALRRDLSQAAQHLPLSVGQPERL